MAKPIDKNLGIIESELRFIGNHLQTVEGNGGSDFDAIDELYMALASAKSALEKYKLSLQPEANEEAAGGALLVTTYELVQVS